MIEIAKTVAVLAHHGQVDQAGQPYIGHPERVATLVSGFGEVATAVAWLHDVVEDSHITLDDLRGLGFPAYVVDAVDAITHRKKESRARYYARIRKNPVALIVKLGDIADNTEPERLAKLPADVADRLRTKYDHALRVLGEKE